LLALSYGVGRPESGSKLRALHTLRATRLRLGCYESLPFFGELGVRLYDRRLNGRAFVNWTQAQRQEVGPALAKVEPTFRQEEVVLGIRLPVTAKRDGR